jgi:hypothetical protein
MVIGVLTSLSICEKAETEMVSLDDECVKE